MKPRLVWINPNPDPIPTEIKRGVNVVLIVAIAATLLADYEFLHLLEQIF